MERQRQKDFQLLRKAFGEDAGLHVFEWFGHFNRQNFNYR